MISNHGLAIVMSGLVLYFAVKFGNIYIENLKAKRGAKSHDELAALRHQVSTTIQTLLDRAILRTRGCRVYVFEFHNGSIGMGGLPFLKMSCIYEALGESVKSVARGRENMSMSLYSTLVESLYQHPFVILDVENRQPEIESSLGYETLIKWGVIVSVRTKITDINRRAIGFVGVDYTERPDDATLQNAISVMQDVAVEVGALLSVK